MGTIKFKQHPGFVFITRSYIYIYIHTKKLINPFDVVCDYHNRYIVADCDSVDVYYNQQHYTSTPEEAAADAIKAG